MSPSNREDRSTSTITTPIQGRHQDDYIPWNCSKMASSLHSTTATPTADEHNTRYCIAPRLTTQSYSSSSSSSSSSCCRYCGGSACPISSNSCINHFFNDDRYNDYSSSTVASPSSVGTHCQDAINDKNNHDDRCCSSDDCVLRSSKGLLTRSDTSSSNNSNHSIVSSNSILVGQFDYQIEDIIDDEDDDDECSDDGDNDNDKKTSTSSVSPQQQNQKQRQHQQQKVEAAVVPSCTSIVSPLASPFTTCCSPIFYKKKPQQQQQQQQQQHQQQTQKQRLQVSKPLVKMMIRSKSSVASTSASASSSATANTASATTTSTACSTDRLLMKRYNSMDDTCSTTTTASDDADRMLLLNNSTSTSSTDTKISCKTSNGNSNGNSNMNNISAITSCSSSSCCDVDDVDDVDVDDDHVNDLPVDNVHDDGKDHIDDDCPTLGDLLKHYEPDVYGQIHPIETPDLIERSLVVFEYELAQLPSNETHCAYVAQRECPTITTSDFKIVFIRTEAFRIGEAVKRYAIYWTKRVQLFGPERAFIPLTLSNLTPNEIKILRMGYQTILQPSSSSSSSSSSTSSASSSSSLRSSTNNSLTGIISTATTTKCCTKNSHCPPEEDNRLITYIDYGNYCKTTMQSMDFIRCIWYLFHALMDECVTTQRRGAVFVVNVSKMKMNNVPSKEWMKRYTDSMRNCVPLRLSAYHVVHSPNLVKVLFPMVSSICLNDRLRKRILVHNEKDNDSIVSKLCTKYNFDIHTLPYDVGGMYNGSIRTLLHDWIEQRIQDGK